MDKEILNKYVEDKNLFRKAIKNCKNNKELFELLNKINCGGYKLYIPNKWDIPVEEIVLYENGLICCYFYLSGSRKYKSISGLSKVIELINCNSKYEHFSLDYYKKE